MKKTRTETQATRARIVANASVMILKKGLAAVGMREVMAASSLTQGGFYRHFASRDELVAEAYELALDHLFEMIEYETTDKPAAKALSTVINIYLDQSEDDENTVLCPLAMLGSELTHCDPKIRAIAMDGHTRLVEFIREQLIRLGRKNASVLASSITSTLVGAVTLSNIANQDDEARRILMSAKTSLKEQISGQD
jgi:TetR/AcrR family transcriptional regulator, transcriptional repressor for nem operon